MLLSSISIFSKHLSMKKSDCTLYSYNYGLLNTDSLLFLVLIEFFSFVQYFKSVE